MSSLCTHNGSDCLASITDRSCSGFRAVVFFCYFKSNLYQWGTGNYNKSLHAWNPSWLLLINFQTPPKTFQITSPLIKTSLIHFNFSQSSPDGSLHALERIVDAHMRRQVSFISHMGDGRCFIIQRERDASAHILKGWILSLSLSQAISPCTDECHSLSNLWRSNKNCFWRARDLENLPQNDPAGMGFVPNQAVMRSSVWQNKYFPQNWGIALRTLSILRMSDTWIRRLDLYVFAGFTGNFGFLWDGVLGRQEIDSDLKCLLSKVSQITLVSSLGQVNLMEDGNSAQFQWIMIQGGIMIHIHSEQI